jgi:hypothetical protein
VKIGARSGPRSGIGKGQDLVTGAQDGGATDRNQLVVANHKADQISSPTDLAVG